MQGGEEEDRSFLHCDRRWTFQPGHKASVFIKESSKGREKYKDTGRGMAPKQKKCVENNSWAEWPIKRNKLKEANKALQ